MKHIVKKTDACYVCTRCGRASGDGDGLVGGKCTPPDAVSLGRLGGLARAKNLGKAELSAISAKGNAKRWAGHVKKSTGNEPGKGA